MADMTEICSNANTVALMRDSHRSQTMGAKCMSAGPHLVLDVRLHLHRLDLGLVHDFDGDLRASLGVNGVSYSALIEALKNVATY